MFNRQIETLLSTISSFGMVEDRDHLLIALSGGADSTALLVAMAEIAPRYNLTLSAAHVNHGLRGREAARDARHAERITKEIGKRYAIEIPFFLHKADVKKIAKEKKLSLHEAGRLVRDTFFRDLMREIGATKIATGHTASDNAETLLMRLITGAGAEGLAGIPPVRLPYIRPLITTTRAEVEAFLTERSVSWIVDSSNLTSDYLRNRIRNEVMPALASINPNVEHVLTCAVAGYRERFTLLKAAAESIVQEDLPDDSYPVEKLSALRPDLCSEVVKLLVFRSAKNTSRPIRLLAPHIGAVMELIESAPRGQKEVPLPGGLIARRTYDILTIGAGGLFGRPRPIERPDDRAVPVPIPGSAWLPRWSAKITAEIVSAEDRETGDSGAFRPPDTPWFGIGRVEDVARFDFDTISGPLFVRTRKPGDRIHPAGGIGTKKLSDLLIDEKIPRDERDSIPLLVSGDDVLWVVGIRTDGRFIVTEKTRRVLVVTVARVGA